MIAVIFLVLEILILLIAIGTTFWIRKKRAIKNQQNPPEGFVRTDEIFIDPTTKTKQEVWFHPETGKRFYRNLG